MDWSAYELAVLSNCVNEAIEALHGWELEVRVGEDEASLRALQARLATEIDRKQGDVS